MQGDSRATLRCSPRAKRVKVDEEGSRRAPAACESEAAGLARLRPGGAGNAGRSGSPQRWRPSISQTGKMTPPVGGVYVPSRMHFLPQWSLSLEPAAKPRRGLLGD